jgi:hypothetical protein
MKRAQPLNINLHYYYNIAVFWCMILNIEHSFDIHYRQESE